MAVTISFRRSIFQVALCAIPLLAGCIVAAPDASTRTVRSSTPAGQSVRVASFARWTEQCEQAGLPAALVTTAPAHGALTVRQAMVTVGGRLHTGRTNCRDKQIPGVELWYAPADGYRGTDLMRYEVDTGEGAARFSATVDVR